MKDTPRSHFVSEANQRLSLVALPLSVSSSLISRLHTEHGLGTISHTTESDLHNATPHNPLQTRISHAISHSFCVLTALSRPPSLQIYTPFTPYSHSLCGFSRRSHSHLFGRGSPIYYNLRPIPPPRGTVSLYTSRLGGTGSVRTYDRDVSYLSRGEDQDNTLPMGLSISI